MKKTFKIPLTWEVYGTLEIEADTLEEAIEIALDDNTALPTDSNYVDGSVQCDTEIIEMINDETV